jgi:hypothetical protein
LRRLNNPETLKLKPEKTSEAYIYGICRLLLEQSAGVIAEEK